MKQVLFFSLLFTSFSSLGQNKTGIFEYGNPSVLIAGINDVSKTAITDYLLKPNEIAFNEKEDHLYIKTNDDYYYFKNNPDKKIFVGWDLFSQQKQVFDPEKLPQSREGRSILALFTPNKKLPAYRNEKKERGGWQTETWISADLKVSVADNFTINLMDTNNKKITAVNLPNPVNDYKTDRWKYTKEKPKDFDIDLGFCYYEKNNLLYIIASWGFSFPDEAERIWQYNLTNNALTEIPLSTINAKEIDFNSKTVFRNEYMIRTIKETSNHIAIPSYEILSLADGKLVANSKEPADTRYPLPLTPLGYLTNNKQMISFDFDKLNYYNNDLQYQNSFILDMGKGVTFEEPAILSKSGKFIAFIKIFKHPEIGYYYSVNYTLFDDLKNGYITSLNDNTIHAPLITKDYASQDAERKKTLLAQKQKELDELKKQRDLTISMIKKRNDELFTLYNEGKYAAMLEKGDIWKVADANLTWTQGKTNMLNEATKFRLDISYELVFKTATEKSGNYVNMTCTERTEAHKDLKLITKEDKISGESYYKPTNGSRILQRNPNYRFGNTYMNYDTPDAAEFLTFLEQNTGLFMGNSFEISIKELIGIPIIVLKYPVKNTNKFNNVFQFEILRWIQDWTDQTKEMEKIVKEMKEIN